MAVLWSIHVNELKGALHGTYNDWYFRFFVKAHDKHPSGYCTQKALKNFHKEART